MKNHAICWSRFLLLFCVLLGLLSFPVPVEASTFVVNSDDDLDDGLCDSNHCSLREAINAANNNPGPDVIDFNIPGSQMASVRLDTTLPALTDDATTIDGTSEPDYVGDPVVLIGKASGVMEIGLSIQSNNNVIRGLHLAGFGGFPPVQLPPYQDYSGGAIIITGSGNSIEDNEIGMGAWWNSIGVRIEGPGNAVIGNVISGNGVGIYADHPNQVIQGNFIGPGSDGLTVVHNSFGIVLETGADGTLIGGSAPGEGNVISGNHRHGIYSHANYGEIYGNLIGVDATGTSAMPNELHGLIFLEENNSIGGAGPGEGNVISGNDACGIWISDRWNVIQGNKIGTDISGSVMIPNDCGIETEADPITIGGLAPGEGNLIMGNTGIGLRIDDLGEATYVAGNTIALNGSYGIRISVYYDEDSSGNTFTRNSIYQNGDLGIEIGAQNDGIQPPVLNSGLSTTISGTACPNCLVEIFFAAPDPTGFGEGKEFIGDGMTAVNGSFSIPTSGTGFCKEVTATATDSNGNTSEFSQNVTLNCIQIQPPFLYPIWVFIITVFVLIFWGIRRLRPSMPVWLVPAGAIAFSIGFILLFSALPFVQTDMVPRKGGCGNGIVEAGELCDGDDLSLCLSGQICQNCRCVTVIDAYTCGDGDVDADEQCDGDDLTMCLSGQICQNCRCVTVIPADACGDGVVNEGEQCDGDDLSMCLSGQVCQNCRCVTVIEAEPSPEVIEILVTPTPQVELCVYEAFQNTNCRESDYAESDLVAILMQGEKAELTALNPEFTHGKFELEDKQHCWIWLGLMDGPENPYGTCNVPVVDPPEKPGEAACQVDLSEEACTEAGGEWIVGVAPYCNCPGE